MIKVTVTRSKPAIEYVTFNLSAEDAHALQALLGSFGDELNEAFPGHTRLFCALASKLEEDIDFTKEEEIRDLTKKAIAERSWQDGAARQLVATVRDARR